MLSSLIKHIKNYFVPHKQNNFHPYILHTKRVVFYGIVFAIMKAIAIVFALFVPAQAFLLPDVLAEQNKQIIVLTNLVRQEKGLKPLIMTPQLDASAGAKVADMSLYSYFSHTGPQDRTLSYFLHQAGYPYEVAGENLAMGFADAPAVVNAWIKSPGHYANLIDRDYRELGVGLESGSYSGEPTVYVAQHFGVRAAALASTLSSESVENATTPTDETVLTARENNLIPVVDELASISSEVQGAKIKNSKQRRLESPAGALDKKLSRVYWLEQGDGATQFIVSAVITGPVRGATVYVNNYPVELHQVASSSRWSGTITAHEPADAFFSPAITPTVIVMTGDGKEVQDSIDWFNIKVSNVGPLQQYIRARDMLAPLTKLFTVSRGIYLAFIIFFTLALAINILVEIRKQHYHVIAQTLLILVLLVWLLKF